MLAAGVASSTSTPVPSFTARKFYRTGAGFPTFVGVTDLNGDSHPDVATLEGSRLSVFLNRGDGTLGPRSDYQTGRSPNASALADMNGDGRPDLVTANSGNGGTVSVLLNRSDGTFAPRHDFPTGGGFPHTLAIADLNGDGKADLIDAHGNTVSVLLGNGDGTVQPKQDYGLGAFQLIGDQPLGVADVSGDGRPDLVAAAYGSHSLGVLVFLGNGDGSFQVPQESGGAGDSVALADLNGDGSPDLVTWFSGCCGGPAAVSLNRRDGSFGPWRHYLSGGGIIPPGGGGPDRVQVADLNGDGRPDLVARDSDADLYGIGLSVLLNRGDGSFGSRRDYRVAGDLTGLAIGDVNGDGGPDLAAADNAFDAVSLFLNNGQGRFQARRDYAVGHPYRDVTASNVTISDLNGDGRPDFVTTDSNTVSVLRSQPGLCNVQDVLQMKPATAKWRLARVDCRPVIRRVFDPKRDREVDSGCGGWAYWPKGGLVFTQEPFFGAVLPAGSKVHLVVRFGRARQRRRGIGWHPRTLAPARALCP